MAQPVLYFHQPVAATNAAPFTTVGMAIHTDSYPPAVVEQLGMFDNFGEIQEPHTVGLWRIDFLFIPSPGPFPDFSYRASLVATSQFLPGDDAFQVGGYRFHSIPPLQLERNQRYVVATHYPLNSTAPVAQVPLRSLRNPAAAFRLNRPNRALALLEKFEQRIQERLMPVDAYYAHSLLDASEAIREAFQPDESLQ